MNYKGYTGSCGWSVDDRCYFGVVGGIADLVTFEAPTRQEMPEAFRQAVDEYLQLCADQGRKPGTP